MIDGSEKRNRQLAFELQNSHVCEKRIRICDRSAQFLVNCFEKIVMATNNSGLNSNYLLVSEERRERERRERHRVRINRRASEEDSSGKFMQHLRLVH